MKRIISFILTAVMVLSLCMPVYASNPGMQNFVNKNKYSYNFTDVAANNWAAPSITACYELGIMYGSSDTTFSPSDNLTIAEALVMACRIYSIYGNGQTAVFSGGNPWYQPYVDFAISCGLIASGDFTDYNVKITRAQMAYVFYNSLPESEFNAINDIASIPDVSVSHKYYHEIKGLYEAGVLTGSDTKGTFYPSNNITRAEAAAIISRVAKPSLRQTITIVDTSPSTALTAQQISALCSSAVAYVEVYNSGNNLLATGSGFFIDSDGTFVTNFHVISKASIIKVTTTDGKTYSVSGVYDADAARDTALLKVNGSKFDYLDVDTGPLEAGETVYVIGSPRGLSNSISSGIVSNVSRELQGFDYIQFTAPISSGSSGGALINEHGKVIGITSASVSSSATSTSQNLNLAIPISYVGELSKNSVRDLVNLGYIILNKFSLSLSTDQITIKSIGETQSITVSFTKGAEDYLYAKVPYYDDRLATVFWGETLSYRSRTLKCIGTAFGRTTVEIGFKYNNLEVPVATLDVRIGSSFEPSQATYRNGAPTYQYITGISCIETYIATTNTTQSGYVRDGNIFTYAMDELGPEKYLDALIAEDWHVYDYSSDDYTITARFLKGDSYMRIDFLFDIERILISIY